MAGTGRRSGLKIRRSNIHVGSTPTVPISGLTGEVSKADAPKTTYSQVRILTLTKRHTLVSFYWKRKWVSAQPEGTPVAKEDSFLLRAQGLTLDGDDQPP